MSLFFSFFPSAPSVRVFVMVFHRESACALCATVCPAAYFSCELYTVFNKKI